MSYVNKLVITLPTATTKTFREAFSGLQKDQQATVTQMNKIFSDAKNMISDATTRVGQVITRTITWKTQADYEAYVGAAGDVLTKFLASRDAYNKANGITVVSSFVVS